MRREIVIDRRYVRRRRLRGSLLWALMIASVLLGVILATRLTPAVTGVIPCPVTASCAKSEQYNIALVKNEFQLNASLDVLVIEDDAIMRELLTDWLEGAGYVVRSAADGLAGLAEVERAVPALVVTDMCMPGPSGALVIRSLKEEHPAIPVIAISGHFRSSGCRASEALALGAARTLAKPVKRSEMIGAVAELVGPPGPGAR